MDICVIGGADGPTTIFITSSANWYTIAAIAIICIAVVGIIIWNIGKGKNKNSC
jgi:Na+-transporting methylmalonyl-CoA/oxaloacetate decarboxylase beta subunit